MEIKTFIVLFVCLSLVGSVAWVMPTPLQRAQAKIRQLAMSKGLKVNVGKLQGPREEGQMAPESHLATSYGLPREITRSRSDGMIAMKRQAWEIFKANGLNTKGLPTGWCWNRGEGTLNPQQLACLATLVERLPSDVYALSVTPIMAHAYWHEKSTPQQLDDLEGVLKELIVEGF
ncbi:MAG: hypothetical protein KC426_01445 [Oceanospirillaceae bacterium]|nr:hypothetical protein [Oceanospirillaceae bacterium]